MTTTRKARPATNGKPARPIKPSAPKVAKPPATSAGDPYESATKIPGPMGDRMRELVRSGMTPTEASHAYFEEKKREELRDNAFSELPRQLFGACEDVIRHRIEAALGFFKENGCIRENRLREVYDELLEATGVAFALLIVGECGW
jgi:hypothetical protein